MVINKSDFHVKVAGPEMGSFFTRPRSWEILIEMVVTKYARKLDTSGRLMIPKPLREQMNLVCGQVYDFFLHEENGKHYVCIECPGQSELEKAMQIIQQNGLKVTQDDDD